METSGQHFRFQVSCLDLEKYSLVTSKLMDKFLLGFFFLILSLVILFSNNSEDNGCLSAV